MKFLLPVLFISIFSAHAFAQQQEQSVQPKKKTRRDSVYYTKYRDRLIVSLFQSYRYYNISIDQKLVSDSAKLSKLAYGAESNNITGIEVNYDKFGFAIGFKTAKTAVGVYKGNTTYTNLGFNIGGNKWIWENSYRRYRGFYDKNTKKYDSTLYNDGSYTLQPNLRSESYKMKFLYFTNHNKFSFKSGYSCSYRQLRTAASFVLTANGYYNRLNSDSSFVPYKLRGYYSDHADLNGLNVWGASVYGGGSVNLVFWKTLFLNITLVIGPEEQWRTYHYINGNYSVTRNYLSISGDARASLGLNFRRFFLMLSSTSDFCWYNSQQLDFLSTYASANFSIGYRFHMKTPGFYEKFQQSKIYRKL